MEGGTLPGIVRVMSSWQEAGRAGIMLRDRRRRVAVRVWYRGMRMSVWLDSPQRRTSGAASPHLSDVGGRGRRYLRGGGFDGAVPADRRPGRRGVADGRRRGERVCRTGARDPALHGRAGDVRAIRVGTSAGSRTGRGTCSRTETRNQAVDRHVRGRARSLARDPVALLDTVERWFRFLLVAEEH